MSADDKRVREFAYQIWESEGKPEGQGERHWEMARKLAEAEALAPTKPVKGKAAAKPKAAQPKPKPVGDVPASKAKSAAKEAADDAPAAALDSQTDSASKPAAPKKPRAPKKPAAK